MGVETATLAVKRVPLGNGRGAFWTDFLILDCDGSVVRAAHYRLRTPVENPQPMDEQSWDHGIEQGWWSPKSRRDQWRRSAHKASRLEDALQIVLNDSRHDWQTVEAYVRATAWGAGLP